MVADNDQYIVVRPNPEALTHSEIRGRIVGTESAGSGPAEPTWQFHEQRGRLETLLSDLIGMVGRLQYRYQAESIEPATSAITRLNGHVALLGAHAEQVAAGFDAYVDSYRQARARMPEPVPFADQLDAVEQHHPGLLSQVPLLAQLEEEHQARTRQARELYRELDRAALTADATTPGFPLLAEAATADDAATTFTQGTASAPARSGGDRHVPPTGPAGPTSPVPGHPPGPAPVTPPPAYPAPAPTPPAAGSHPVPLPGPAVPARPPAREAGLPSPPPAGHSRPGRDHGPATRPPGRTGSGPGSRQHDVISRDSGRAGPGGGRAAGFDPGSSADQAARTSFARPAAVGHGPGLGPVGAPGATRDDDREHRRLSFLEADDDPDALFGTDQLTAPPVIGVPPSPDHEIRQA